MISNWKKNFGLHGLYKNISALWELIVTSVDQWTLGVGTTREQCSLNALGYVTIIR